MISIPLILLVTGLLTAATPTSNKLIGRDDDVRCGTTQDADLAACKSILDNWTGNLVWENTCSYGGFIDETGGNTAHNVASVPGCSVYVTDPGKEPEAVKEAVQKLLGCADQGKGKVNGVTVLADKTGVCIGGNDGCGDCFDDGDFDDIQGRSLERRAGKADIASAVAGLGSSLLGLSGSDDTKRANGVRNMVDGMAKQFGVYNIVACHTDHEARFDGEQDKDWFHEHFEIDIDVGGTIGYELYVGGSGTFKRNGDGGEINWGWNAVLTKDPEEDGSLLTFAPMRK